MAESIITEAPATIPTRNDMFDAAHLKLEYARAIIDTLAMLDVSGSTDSLTKGSLTACLLHSEELLGEAGHMFTDAQAQPAGVHHD
jgi:hypothetical protein